MSGHDATKLVYRPLF